MILLLSGGKEEEKWFVSNKMKARTVHVTDEDLQEIC